jgi:hypothetical protein
MVILGVVFAAAAGDRSSARVGAERAASGGRALVAQECGAVVQKRTCQGCARDVRLLDRPPKAGREKRLEEQHWELARPPGPHAYGDLRASVGACRPPGIVASAHSIPCSVLPHRKFHMDHRATQPN